MPYRFVHAADIHLDSPVRSVALADPELAAVIGNATRQAFVRIIDLCLEEQVDALLLAGDLYDGEQTSMKTARFLAEQLRRLSERGIRTYIIRGNHDVASRITRELELPEHVKVFGGRAEAVQVEGRSGAVPIIIHGLSWPYPQAPESLVGRYRSAVPDAVNIGMMHTSLSGATGHDVFAPCTLEELQATGFQYWALGHLHQRMVSEGPCTIVMPGIPQGRDLSEPGPRSATLVTIRPDRSVQVEERVTSVAQLERISLAITGCEAWEELVQRITQALEQARRTMPSGHLVIRLALTGATPLAWRIRKHLDLLTAEARERARVIGACWVEKIEAAITLPVIDKEPCEPMLQLKRLMEQDGLHSDSVRTQLTALCELLRRQLPAECREALGADQASFEQQLTLLAREGIEDVLARLHADTPRAG